jgi:hypothetical protein
MRFLFIKEMLEFTILTVSMLAMMYLFAWWVITQAMADVVSSSLLVNRDTPPINRDIQELNRLSRNVNLSSQDYAQLSPLLFELSAILPDNIKLIAIDFDRQRNSVSFSGTASTRDALINFQKVVSEIKWLSGVSAPASQLFQKENISFEMRGTLQGLPPLKKN